MTDLEYRDIFTKKLNYYMKLNGKKQQDLIDDLNLSSSTVSSWCNGKRLPRMGKIQMLADYFNIEKSDLIEDKSKTTVTPENMLLGHFNKLNQTGKNEAIKQVENLTYNPNYTNIAQFKARQPDPDPYRVIAAHNDNTDPDQYDLMMEDAADLLDD